jgi:CBS domain-containing protein
MFDADVLEPDVVMEPDMLISRGKDLRRLAFLTPIRSLPMKPALLLPPETSLAEATGLMLNENARAALIVCGDSVLGLLDQANILRMTRAREVDLERTSVWRAMTVDPPRAADSDSVATALRSFRAHRVDHLCVSRQDGAPVGILDMGTVVDWMSNQLTVIVFDNFARG